MSSVGLSWYYIVYTVSSTFHPSFLLKLDSDIPSAFYAYGLPISWLPGNQSKVSSARLWLQFDSKCVDGRTLEETVQYHVFVLTHLTSLWAESRSRAQGVLWQRRCSVHFPMWALKWFCFVLSESPTNSERPCALAICQGTSSCVLPTLPCLLIQQMPRSCVFTSSHARHFGFMFD